MGPRMSITIQESVGEHRAAVLLGRPTTEIRRFSRLSGLGRLEMGGRGEQVVFTFDELQRLCLLAAQSSKSLPVSAKSSPRLRLNPPTPGCLPTGTRGS